MECKEIISHLSEFIDGELEECECTEIREHLDKCPVCHSIYDSLLHNIQLCKKMLKIEIPEEIRFRLRERLHKEYGKKDSI